MKAEIKITLDEIIEGLIEKDDMQPIIDDLKDRAITRFCEVLLHAPSSPVSCEKASEIHEWYEKAKNKLNF